MPKSGVGKKHGSMHQAKKQRGGWGGGGGHLEGLPMQKSGVSNLLGDMNLDALAGGGGVEVVGSVRCDGELRNAALCQRRGRCVSA